MSFQRLNFHQTNFFFAANAHPGIYIWSVKTGKLLRSIKDKNAIHGITNFYFSPDSKEILAHYFAGMKEGLSVWSIRKNKMIRQRTIYEQTNANRTGKHSFNSEIVFSDDGKYFVNASENYDIQVWNYKSLDLVQSWKSSAEDQPWYAMNLGLKKLAVSNDGNLAFGMQPDRQAMTVESNIFIWDVNFDLQPESKLVSNKQVYLQQNSKFLTLLI